MKDNLPKYNDKQIKLYEVSQKIYMAWATLAVILVLFIIVLAFFMYRVAVSHVSDPATWLTGLINTTLGVSIRQIVVHLFPTPPKEPKSRAPAKP